MTTEKNLSTMDLAAMLESLGEVDGDGNTCLTPAVVRAWTKARVGARIKREDADMKLSDGDQDLPVLTPAEFDGLFGETPWSERRRIDREEHRQHALSKLQAHFERTGCVGETYAA